MKKLTDFGYIHFNEDFKVISYHDLEMEIHKVWNVVDDLGTFEQALNNEDLSEDDIINLVIGIRTMADLRLKQLFSVYEDYLENERVQNEIRKAQEETEKALDEATQSVPEQKVQEDL